jgi:hypothetical protein
MPKKQHLPSVSDKEQRMYEHIKESELEQGRPIKRAKAIAAATVNKHHNEEGHAKGRWAPRGPEPVLRRDQVVQDLVAVRFAR